jgi:hypothetical protein
VTASAILIIRPEHSQRAEELFRDAGFIPAELRKRADGNVEFVFGPEAGGQLLRLFNTVPEQFHAFSAIIGDDPGPLVDE